ncbi:MAG TPA: sigma-70 family RNA polymerase sigma factor [Terriglobales bacterium]|nr:sigma-70 family RNA polymerase sigma factor [Terriglobales bacterium]
MRAMAGAAALGNLAAGALEVRQEEASIVAELKAGSEEAYSWLIAQYQPPVYNLTYRILNDSAEAADTTQEVFLKVFRGMQHFNGASSLKTWIYRIAVHEASNRRRWWFRHKSKETSMEPADEESFEPVMAIKDKLIDDGSSPFEDCARSELKGQVEAALTQVPEPYRTALVLRDMEELSYEEIAEITESTMGTVKSRITRGREQLKKRLEKYLRNAKPQVASPLRHPGREVEVAS